MNRRRLAMEKQPPTPPRPDPQDQPEAPPFEPDPRLVTYLERGAGSDAPQRFRAEIERNDR
jgi:hypothetical protein